MAVAARGIGGTGACDSRDCRALGDGGIGKRLYGAGNFSGAGVVWTAASWTSVWERDVILYDLGNGLYQSGNYQSAAQRYQQASAVASATHVCVVDYNWGLALSAWGDKLAGSSAQNALAQYGNAVRALSAPTCNRSSTYQTPYGQLRQELEQKIANLSQPPKAAQVTQDSGAAQQILDDRYQELLQQRITQQTAQTENNPNYTNGTVGSFTW